MATKSQELSNPNSCLNKAADDEPIFVLRAQDLSAPDLVRRWANEAEEHGCGQDKAMEAHALADAMEAWPTRKHPD